MERWALITGASSGLGAEYAQQLARLGMSLVLVARDREALRTLASSLREAHGVHVEVLAADLLKPRHRERVERRLTDGERPVDLLVNNAGYGLPLAFEASDIDEEVRHLELHVEVPMRLMRAALPGMLRRRTGRILNVASIAGLVPRGTYGAAKGWLVSFSRWANVRYRPRGVSVTAVCPGFVHTNFHERMGLPPGKEGVPEWMWLNARDVVAESLRDAAHGKSVSIPSLKYKLLARLARLLPESVVVKVAERGR